MHPVHYHAVILCQCSQTIGIHMVWWDASCSLSCFDSVSMQTNHRNSDASCSLSCSDLVSVQPNHRNSYGLVRCILFIIVLWFGVNAAKPWDFIWFGEMHPVHDHALIWCQCSQTIGIYMFWWDASCSLSCFASVSVQANHRNSDGLVRCILFIIVLWFGVSAAKP